MDNILASVRCQFALEYLDDICVFSKLPEEHIEQVMRNLRLLYKAEITLKPRKCRFFAEASYYLEHVIRPGHLEIAEDPTDVITKLEQPTLKTEFCSFSGLCKLLLCFVPNFANLEAVLNKIFGKDEPRQLGPLEEKQSSAFASLKEP